MAGKTMQLMPYKLYLESDLTKEELKKLEDEKRYVGRFKGKALMWKEGPIKVDAVFHLITDFPIDKDYWLVGVNTELDILDNKTVSNTKTFFGRVILYNVAYSFDIHDFINIEKPTFTIETIAREYKDDKGNRWFIPNFVAVTNGKFGSADVTAVIDDYNKFKKEG